MLRVMEGEALPAAEMSRLNWRLGGIYADCVERAAAKFGVKVGLVGCHGQTVHHEAAAREYLGAAVRSTWQMGEAAVIAERMRCPVVSDFRPADLAAGGQGAPLVPMLDWCLFRSAKNEPGAAESGRDCESDGAAGGVRVEEVMAFDTGPGNMVIDRCMQRIVWARDSIGMERWRGGGGCWAEVVRRVMREAVLLCPAAEVVRAGGVWGGVCGAVYGDVPGGGRRRCGLRGDGDGVDG